MLPFARAAGTRLNNATIPNLGKVLTVIVVVGASALAIRWGAKKIISSARAQQSQKDLLDPNASPDDKNAAAMATKMYQAMFETGWPFGWGTDEKKLFEAARDAKNPRKTALAYRNLYKRNLLDDVQSELSTDDYDKFMKQFRMTP